MGPTDNLMVEEISQVGQDRGTKWGMRNRGKTDRQWTDLQAASEWGREMEWREEKWWGGETEWGMQQRSRGEKGEVGYEEAGARRTDK